MQFKLIKTAGLCLASMLMVGMALAGTAWAGPLWLVCLPGTEKVLPTKYESNQCIKAAASNAGKWQSLGLPSGANDTVRLLAFSLRLNDPGAAGGTEVKCNLGGRASGLILGPNRGIIALAKVEEPETNCTRSNSACTGIVSVEGRHLPWETEIFATEVSGTEKFLSKIKGTVAKEEPGWAVTCKSILGNKTDVCTNPPNEEEQVELPQGVTGGILLVLARFEGAHKANCTEGGEKRGEVGGLAAILLVTGLGLSINRL